MTWREIGGLGDGGHAGGDVQVGVAYSRRFTKPADEGEHHFVEIHHFAARDIEFTRGARLDEYWIGLEIEYILCTDPCQPGDTEIRSALRCDDSDRKRHVYKTVREAERRDEKLARAIRVRDIDGLLRKVRP
jgi:hypothetical protein